MRKYIKYSIHTIIAFMAIFSFACQANPPIKYRNDNLRFNSYFGEGFGAFISRDVHVKSIIFPDIDRLKSPPLSIDLYMAYSSQPGTSDDLGIALVMTEKLEKDLLKLLTESNFAKVKIIGYESIRCGGVPHLGRRLECVKPDDVNLRQGYGWHAEHVFILEKIYGQNESFRVYDQELPDVE